MRVVGSFWKQRWKTQKKKRKIDPALALRLRLLVFRLVIVLAFAVLLGQLWRLQIVEGDYYRQKAEFNRLRIQTVPPTRGVIYDRTGRLLVRNIPSFTISVVPADVRSRELGQMAGRLSRIVGLPPDDIVRQVEERRRLGLLFNPLPLKTNVDQLTAFTVEENHPVLPGVVVEIEPIRQYIEGPLTSHLLGYVRRISDEEHERLKSSGYEINDKVGKMGVELTFESTLRGAAGKEEVQVDVNGRKIEVLNRIDPEPGHNVVLTIDVDLQRRLTDILRRGLGESLYATAVLMDVRSGEILAMISLPSFDSNLFSRPLTQRDLDDLYRDKGRPLINHAISSAHPPGSTFKLVTAAAALQEGVVTPSTVIQCNGALVLPGGVRFNDWAAHGPQNLQQAITNSCDVYFYTVAGGYGDFRGLGPDRLATYARDFGLDAPTGIDLPNEAKGLIPDTKWKQEQLKEPWYQGETYNVGIGQGQVNVTSLQLVRVVATVANGGFLLKPQIIRAIVGKDGRQVRAFGRAVVREVKVSKQHLAEIRQGMYEAAHSAYGTARAGQVAGRPDIPVGGKTGTAEFGRRDPKTGDYETHGLYVTFAPFDKPEIALAVFLQTGRGAQNAAPVASEMLRAYFDYRS